MRLSPLVMLLLVLSPLLACRKGHKVVRVASEARRAPTFWVFTVCDISWV